MALFTPPIPSPVKLFGVRTSIVALASLVVLLYYGRDFFVTLIVSAVFAFILDPLVVLVMKLWLPRPAATAIVLGFACLAIALVASIAWMQARRLTLDLPTYTSRMTELWDKTSEQLEGLEQGAIAMVVPQLLREQGEQIQQKPQEAMQARKRRNARAKPVAVPAAAPPAIQEVRIHADPKPLLVKLYSYSSRYFHFLFLASFVPFLVYFMLSWRDHVGKSFMRMFQGHARYVVGKSWTGIGVSTRAYVLGNFILWVLLSSISAIAFFFLGVPYWALAGFASAFFSLVPYAGLPLSILPPVLAAVAVPNKFKIVLAIVLLTVALHLLAMNVLYAKIVGRRVRLNPLVVTIALLFWGLIWGGIGLVLAIPIMAGIKTVCDNVESLEPYGRLLGD